MKKRIFLLLTAAALLCGCGRSVPAAVPETAAAETTAATTPVTEATVPETTEPTLPPEQRFTFTFAGDCTLGCHTDHTHADFGFLLTVKDRYDYPFENVRQYFENDDFTMVNLEGVLSDEGFPVSKRFTFRGPAAYTQILTGSSVEAVSLANNHTLDYNEAGYAATKAALDAAGVSYVETNSSTLITLESGLTVGLYGTVYNSIDPEAMVAGIRSLKEQGADIVIYAPHWGVEHSFWQNQQQIDLGHAAIDAGADIVFGCHPHVLQPIEEYAGGIIYYSLGNFCFGGNIYPGDYDTAIVQQEVILSPEGQISLGETTIIPCTVSSMEGRNNYQPTPYPEGSEEYDRVLSKLDGSYDGPNLPVS